MRDVLVCLEAKTGKEQWRVDFVATFKSELPAFGCVCSPLLDGDALYVQAGASVVKLNKKTGEILWRGIQDDGGMNGSAFSSPIIAELAGKRQLVVQTRDRLVGADLATGALLWEQKVPAFRGMNILTPVVIGDAVFTSSYQNKSWLYQITKTNDQFTVKEAWSNNAQGYMSTPVVIGDHIYMHLQSQRFTCINIKTGERTWTSTSFGKYCSLIAQGDRIVALDANGTILYLKANPVAFELIDRFPVSESDTWAHLAVSGNQWFVRELDGLIAFRWGG
jgi:outer membrane protein assembly factor BamB